MSVDANFCGNLRGWLRWHVKNATPEEAFNDAVHALNKLEDKEIDGKTIRMAKTDRMRYFIQCHCFTRAQWLDVVEISFYDGGDGQTYAKVRCF